MLRSRESRQSRPIQHPIPAHTSFSGLNQASPTGISVGHPTPYLDNNVVRWDYQHPPAGWQSPQYPYSQNYGDTAPNPLLNYQQRPQGPYFNPPQPPAPYFPHSNAPIQYDRSQSHLSEGRSRIKANSSRTPRTTSHSRNRSSDRANIVSDSEEALESGLQRETNHAATPFGHERVSRSSHGTRRAAALSDSRSPAVCYELVPVLIATVTRFPSVDWNITYPPSFAHMLIEDGERFPLDMNHKAIVPAVDGLHIKSSKLSPLSLVIERWGPITVRSTAKEFEKSDCVTVGHVLQSIYAYFNTCITMEEIEKLQTESESQTKCAVIKSRSKRWKDLLQSTEIAEKDKDYLLDDIGRDPTRADFLHGYLHYAGLKMSDDFHYTRTLLLTLENQDHVQHSGVIRKRPT